jgi:hypothetical protein
MLGTARRFVCRRLGMAQACSNDIRRRILRTLERGNISLRAPAERFDVSYEYVKKIRKQQLWKRLVSLCATLLLLRWSRELGLVQRFRAPINWMRLAIFFEAEPAPRKERTGNQGRACQ